MLPTTGLQDFNNAQPVLVLLQPFLICPPQQNLFYQQNLVPHHLLPSYRNSELNSNHPLQCYKIEEIKSAVNNEEKLFFDFPPREFSNELELNNCTFKPTKPINNTNSSSAGNIFTDLTNTKLYPPQKKSGLEELQKPKRTRKRWTIKEDQLLNELKKNPYLNWKEIVSKFPDRTLKACQFRMKKLQCIKKKL